MAFRNKRHFASIVILQVQVALLAETEAVVWQARCLRGGMGVDTISSQQLAQPMTQGSAWKPPKAHRVGSELPATNVHDRNAIDAKARSMAIWVHLRLSRCLNVVAFACAVGLIARQNHSCRRSTLDSVFSAPDAISCTTLSPHAAAPIERVSLGGQMTTAQISHPCWSFGANNSLDVLTFQEGYENYPPAGPSGNCGGAAAVGVPHTNASAPEPYHGRPVNQVGRFTPTPL